MDDGYSSVVLGFAASLVCIFLYGFFALSRTALIRSRSAVLAEPPHSNTFGAGKARVLLAKANYQISLAQTASFCFASLASVFSITSAVMVFDMTLARNFIWLLLLLAVIALLSVLSSAIQRGFAYKDPNLTLRLIAYPFYYLSLPFAPIAYLAGKILNLIGAQGINIPKEREYAASAEQISEMLEISTEAGEIEEGEREMIQGVFDFSDTVVREVMTPRQDIVGLPLDSTVQQALDLLLSEGHSRLLVYGRDIDDVRGVLMVKDLLPLVGKSLEGKKIVDYVRSVRSVPGDKKVDALMRQFKREAVHFAVVLDEHGGVDGIVTMEDLIEQLVGDIYDEYDSPEDQQQEITETGSGEIIVDGGALIDDLNEQYSLHVPTGEYDTVAGFVIHHLGYIPTSGEIVNYNGYTIKVEEIENNRITQLRIAQKVLA